MHVLARVRLAMPASPAVRQPKSGEARHEVAPQRDAQAGSHRGPHAGNRHRTGQDEADDCRLWSQSEDPDDVGRYRLVGVVNDAVPEAGVAALAKAPAKDYIKLDLLAINEILRQLNAGPPDGMTVTDITAGQSTYARSTIASAAIQARRSGLIERCGTRPAAGARAGGPQYLWRRTAAGQP